MENVTIQDLKKSVEIGEKIEDRIAELLEKRYGYHIIGMPDYSDLDRLVIPKAGFPFYLEIKARDHFFKEAICPIRKYQIAQAVKERLKMNCYALFYFKDHKNIGYLYDLTQPVKTGMVRRKDRNIESEYGYYVPYKHFTLILEP